MYKLYYIPGASSLAIHVLLHELNQKTEFIPRPDQSLYASINPANKVPALVDDNGETYLEGAAIALYLMDKHASALLPTQVAQRNKAIQWMMFANASVYTAYIKLFFAKGQVTDPDNRATAMSSALAGLMNFWKIADDQLSKTRFLAGDTLSMGDIFLTVYAGWNKNFPGLVLGKNAARMVNEISERPSFQKAISEEKIEFNIQH